MGSGFPLPLNSSFQNKILQKHRCRHSKYSVGGSGSCKSVLHLPCNILQLRLVDTFQEGYWFLMVLELIGGGDLFTATGLARPHRAFFCSLTVHSDIAMTEIPNNLILMHTRALFNPSFPFHLPFLFRKNTLRFPYLQHSWLELFWQSEGPFVCLPRYAVYSMHQTVEYMY